MESSLAVNLAPLAARTHRLGLALALCCTLALAASCLREAKERALGDLDIGTAQAAGLTVATVDGLGNVRSLTDGDLHLWASAPVVAISLTAESDARRDWTFEVENCMPGAELTSDDPTFATIVNLGGPRPAVCRFAVTLADSPGAQRAGTLTLAPPDVATSAPFRFAAMSDIQTGLNDVEEVFAAINSDPGIRFVISTGDLTSNATSGEYDTWLEKLPNLDVPYYSTIGNHELFSDFGLWRRYFGRTTVHFQFQGASFSLVDSASASIDPVVYEWLDGWLAASADRVHVFATHYPPIDPVGIRNGSFNSRNEASKLIRKLSVGAVDLAIYGHIHTYYGFEHADVPAHISGGGGAFQEYLDGVDRHFLAVDVEPGGISQVTVVEVKR